MRLSGVGASLDVSGNALASCEVGGVNATGDGAEVAPVARPVGLQYCLCICSQNARYSSSRAANEAKNAGETAAQSRITKGRKTSSCSGTPADGPRHARRTLRLSRSYPLLHPAWLSANTERDVILASREQAGIMAQRKKRPTARRGKSAARGKARKTSKSARGRAAKRIVATSKQRKSLAKAKPKRAKAKKVAGRRKPMKPPSTPAVETGIVDVIEEPASGSSLPSAGHERLRLKTTRLVYCRVTSISSWLR
jgi:hypothetical protein